MTHPRRWLSAAAVLVLATGGVLAGSAPASAATITVTDEGDSGAGTLREAIATANLDPAPDTIAFQAGLPDIFLDSPITISEPLTIDGPGAAELSILLNAAPRLFTIDMDTAGDVTFDGLTFDGQDNGSGIFATVSAPPLRDLTVTDSIFLDFTDPDDGAAIQSLGNSGDVTLTGSTFQSNDADLDGGAVSLGDVGGDLVITDTRFVENTAGSVGGGVFVNQVQGVRVTNSSFDENSAGAGGGGIAISSVLATSSITATVFDGNLAGTAGNIETQGGALYFNTIASGAVMTIKNSTIYESILVAGDINPRGGGLFVDQLAGTLLIDSSTIARTGLVGAAAGISIGICDVLGTGVFELIDSTIDESLSDDEHAIDVCTNDGEISLLYSTLVGPGILRIGTNGGDAHISSSIVDGGISAILVDGADVDVDWSTLSMPSGAFGIAAGAGVQFSVADPKLGPLQDNGGPTWTRLLLTGSPALNLGNPAVSGEPAFDQRGSGFARVLGGRIDIGAIEMPAALAPTGSTVPLPLVIGAIALVVLGAVAIIVGRLRRRRPSA